MPLKNPKDYPFWFRVVVVATLSLFAINLFFFAAPLAVAVPAITTRDILSATGSLVATFVGAWLAFTFARMRVDRERIEQDIAAGNRALFTLLFMWEEINQRKTEIVEPYRGKRDAWLNLHVGPPMNTKRTFDMKDLSFLMESDAGVFQSLFLEEERFRLAAQLIEDHRSIVFDEAWPRLEAAGVRMGRQSEEEAKIKTILGPGTLKKLTVTTEAIIRNFDENAVSLRAAFGRLRSALKKIHPTRKFIDAQFP